MKERLLRIFALLALLVLGTYISISASRSRKERLLREEERAWLDLGPIQNHPVRIYDVPFSKEFNDLNDVQLQVAQSVGVLPVADRNAAEHLKTKLVKLEDTDTYVVDSLTHSIPYLIPSAKGLNPYKLVVTSVLRTEADVRNLRRHNGNASENSTHRYGTTFDLSYWRYEKIPEFRGRPYEDVPTEYLRATLSQVLRDIHKQPGTCYIKYERKQSCFHITVRK